MSTDARAGIVLAGGFSTRFGDDDKLLATLDGRPLLAHAIAGLAPAVDTVAVSCREDQLEEFRPIFERTTVTVTPAPDPLPDRGPAAGIATALETIDAPAVAVVAGDMPFVDRAVLDACFDQLVDTEAVVPSVDGYRQPTHAVYHTAPLGEAVAAAVEQGDGSLRAVMDRLDVTVVPAAELSSTVGSQPFFDVNTAAELETARERAGGKNE